MLPYLITISLSVVLSYIAEVSFSKSKAVSNLLIASALIIPCVLAGARDYNIGIDTGAYGKLVYEIARNSNSIYSYHEAILNCGFDISLLYEIQSFVVVKLFQSSFWYFFFIQMMMIGPFYAAIHRVSRGRAEWVGILGYLLIFYILGLSAMRQFIAISLSFLSIITLVKDKKIESALWLIAAVLYHSSAVVMLAVYVAWIAVFRVEGRSVNFRRHGIKVGIALLGLSVITAVNVVPVVKALASVIPFFNQYASYFNIGETSSNISFFGFFGFMLFGIILCGRGGIKAKSPVLIFYITMSVYALLIYSLQVVNTEFIRLSYYFWPYYIAATLQCYLESDNIKDNLFNAGIAMIVLMELLQFFWWYMINDYYQCLPYTSAFF